MELYGTPSNMDKHLGLGSIHGSGFVFWFGTNYLLDLPIEPILRGGFLIMAYEYSFVRSREIAAES